MEGRASLRAPCSVGWELTNPSLAQSVWWVLGSGRRPQHLPESSVQTVGARDRARPRCMTKGGTEEQPHIRGLEEGQKTDEVVECARQLIAEGSTSGLAVGAACRLGGA